MNIFLKVVSVQLGIEALVRGVGSKLSGLVIIAVLAGCAPQPNPIPEATDTHWYGNIVSGEKFGVEIGTDFEEASERLVNNGFRADRQFSCSEQNDVMFRCASRAQSVAPFRKRQLGYDGSVFMVYEENEVVRIVWSFSVIRVP